MIVADTNTIVYTVTTSPYSDAAHTLLEKDPNWIAPVLWRSEMANVLALHIRHSILTLSQALQAQSLAEAIMADSEYEVSSANVLALAAESRCSAYDCEFVVLARQMGCQLVTMDRKLVKAFPATARLL